MKKLSNISAAFASSRQCSNKLFVRFFFTSHHTHMHTAQRAHESVIFRGIHGVKQKRKETRQKNRNTGKKTQYTRFCRAYSSSIVVLLYCHCWSAVGVVVVVAAVSFFQLLSVFVSRFMILNKHLEKMFRRAQYLRPVKTSAFKW